MNIPLFFKSDVRFMLDKDLKVIEALNKDGNLSQRELAQRTEMSIGKVNSILKNLVEEGHIRVEEEARRRSYILTEKGLKALEGHIKSTINKKITLPQTGNTKVGQAVLLVAGEKKGFDRPIGSLPLGSATIIERTIAILREEGIEKIIMITGYEDSYFEHLKNSDIHIIKNNDYKWTGTMASLTLARDFITEDFLLVEGDMVFEKRAIKEILGSENRNCVLITDLTGSGDEVLVEIRNGFIFKISKDIHQFNRVDGEMIGMARISHEIFLRMLEEYGNNHNPFFNYEYALMDFARTYDIGYVKVNDLIWTEIDRQWQYKNLINYMYPVLLKKENKN